MPGRNVNFKIIFSLFSYRHINTSRLYTVLIYLLNVTRLGNRAVQEMSLIRYNITKPSFRLLWKASSQMISNLFFRYCMFHFITHILKLLYIFMFLRHLLLLSSLFKSKIWYFRADFHLTKRNFNLSATVVIMICWFCH